MKAEKILLITTHPIQYQAPLFTELAKNNNIHVLYLAKSTSKHQNQSGFNVNFNWDVPLFKDYEYSFAHNIAKHPSPNTKNGILIENPEQLLNSHQPSLIILFGWYTKAHRQIIRVANKNRIPIMLRGESTLIMNNSLIKGMIKRLYFPFFLKKFTHFLSIGKENERFYTFYGVLKSKITLAPYSINTPFFQQKYTASKSPKNNKIIRIGFSGKFIEKKRPLDLIKAVSQSKYARQIKLIMVGDGPLLNEAKSMVHLLNLSAEFKGFLNQSEIIEKGYACMEAIVLPSGDYETWGLVVNEAMTGGIPAIVSNKVGCHTDLIDDTTGFVFESGNIEELASKIDNLCQNIINQFPYRERVLNKIENYSLANTTIGFNTAIEKVLKNKY